jgi:amino-acid N-acetyltransferase
MMNRRVPSTCRTSLESGVGHYPGSTTLYRERRRQCSQRTQVHSSIYIRDNETRNMGHAGSLSSQSHALAFSGKTTKQRVNAVVAAGSLEKSMYGLFVKFFRQATPYIEAHRGRTFVIAIPGEVVDRQDVLDTLLEDIALLHGLGVRLVVVIGARMQINEAVKALGGSEPQYVKGHRVTDDVAMKAAVSAAGAARVSVEARLSRAPTVTMLRRHSRGDTSSSRHQANAVTTVSGNYVAAKRKGVIGGIDYQHTGSVKYIHSDAVRHQLENENIVLLSNLGYSVSGEPLNCDIYSVSVRAAIDLNADKLIVVAPPGDPFLETLPAWLPLQEAQALLLSGSSRSSLDEELHDGDSRDVLNTTDEEAFRIAQDDLDFDSWYELGLPMPLLAAYMVCRSGVKRAHVVDALIDGALLLELYSTDGVGCMISSDFYEGIRSAIISDIPKIFDLLQPMVDKGMLVQRTREQLMHEITHFTVLERENQLLACAYVRPLGLNDSGEQVAELGAFCVHPEYRGGGKGDTLLEYLEDRSLATGTQMLILLTTRAADWFEQRGFSPAGAAHSSKMIPAYRRKEIDISRNSQLYYKSL